MIRRRRKDSQHLNDAAEHLQVLREHLARGSLDDALIRDAVSPVTMKQPFLVSEQERVLCGPNGVGRWRWVLSGGPSRLVIVVDVAVSRDYGTVVVWCSAGDRAWPVVYPHTSAVGCGVLPAVA